MIIAQTSTFVLGDFTVQERPRFDNPAFAVYIVLRAGCFIGKSFSRPDLDCCKWLARQKSEELVYAECSAPLKDKGREHTLRGIEKARHFSLSARRIRWLAESEEIT